MSLLDYLFIIYVASFLTFVVIRRARFKVFFNLLNALGHSKIAVVFYMLVAICVIFFLTPIGMVVILKDKENSPK